MNLSLLILIPLLTAIAVLLCEDLKQVRVVALLGAVVQLFVAFFLLYAYSRERASGNTAQMLFEDSHAWFTPLILIIMWVLTGFRLP